LAQVGFISREKSERKGSLLLSRAKVVERPPAAKPLGVVGKFGGQCERTTPATDNLILI
jgi:hypothetical protein